MLIVSNSDARSLSKCITHTVIFYISIVFQIFLFSFRWRFNDSRHPSLPHRGLFNPEQWNHPWWAPLWPKSDVFTDPGPGWYILQFRTHLVCKIYHLESTAHKDRLFHTECRDPQIKGSRVTPPTASRALKHFIWQFFLENDCKAIEVLWLWSNCSGLFSLDEPETKIFQKYWEWCFLSHTFKNIKLPQHTLLSLRAFEYAVCWQLTLCISCISFEPCTAGFLLENLCTLVTPGHSSF